MFAFKDILKKNSFSSMQTTLLELDLHSNQLELIQNETFYNLFKLTKIDLRRTVSLAMLLRKNEKMKGHFQFMPNRAEQENLNTS